MQSEIRVTPKTCLAIGDVYGLFWKRNTQRTRQAAERPLVAVEVNQVNQSVIKSIPKTFAKIAPISGIWFFTLASFF